MAATPETPSPDSWADSSDKWAARRLHKVVMPSGAKAVIQIPELGMLALANAVPDDFAELARAELTHKLGMMGAYADEIADAAKLDDQTQQQRVSMEATERFSRLLKWLVAEHVLVEPRVTIEELSDDERFPLADLDWLYGVATRRVSEDALGRRLGVARLDEFAGFPEAHGCSPSCEHCLEVLDRFSTADLGAL